MTAHALSPDHAALDLDIPSLRRTARGTGVWYLLVGLTGMAGFLVLRPQLFVDDGVKMAAALAERESMARLVVALEIAVCVTQAAAAVWFYKLLSAFDRTDGFSTAAFGLANALLVLVSAAATSLAISVATGALVAPGGDVVGGVALFSAVSSSAWSLGGVFFGLWLIPMGHAAFRSGHMPRALGIVLMVGGVGYVASALVGHGLVAAPTWLRDGLAIPATVGEFWMIGWLLVVGVRSRSSSG
jgi:hypothetical protein